MQDPRIIATAMLNPLQAPRPRLTGPILLYGLGDIFGLTCVAVGATWFIAEKGVLIESFPSNMAEAVACTAGGIVVMLWSVARILRELSKQAPEMQARYDAYLAAKHPGRKPADDNSQP